MGSLLGGHLTPSDRGSAFARGNLLLPTSARPIDFIYGDGRRIGISLRYEP